MSSSDLEQRYNELQDEISRRGLDDAFAKFKSNKTYNAIQWYNMLDETAHTQELQQMITEAQDFLARPINANQTTYMEVVEHAPTTAMVAEAPDDLKADMNAILEKFKLFWEQRGGNITTAIIAFLGLYFTLQSGVVDVFANAFAAFVGSLDHVQIAASAIGFSAQMSEGFSTVFTSLSSVTAWMLGGLVEFTPFAIQYAYEHIWTLAHFLYEHGASLVPATVAAAGVVVGYHTTKAITDSGGGVISAGSNMINSGLASASNLVNAGVNNVGNVLILGFFGIFIINVIK